MSIAPDQFVGAITVPIRRVCRGWAGVVA
jgi:hypothetical protein